MHRFRAWAPLLRSGPLPCPALSAHLVRSPSIFRNRTLAPKAPKTLKPVSF